MVRARHSPSRPAMRTVWPSVCALVSSTVLTFGNQSAAMGWAFEAFFWPRSRLVVALGCGHTAGSGASRSPSGETTMHLTPPVAVRTMALLGATAMVATLVVAVGPLDDAGRRSTLSGIDDDQARLDAAPPEWWHSAALHRDGGGQTERWVQPELQGHHDVLPPRGLPLTQSTTRS